ncbi:MAG: KEOPS complex subunit Cgi121 [Candidatus Micrarchaeota archaeon]|nr:KEOPS complex subunit Cgi121 [Candidatus Micrarchaeota archaeon]
MFAVHLIKSSKPLEDILKHSGTFVLISKEYSVVPRFVQYAFMQAFKTFETGRQTAKTLNLEWLAKLAMSKNVSNAVNFTKPGGNEICFAAVNCFEADAKLAEIGVELQFDKKFREKAESILAEKYNISAKALEVYKLEDLLIEKAAVENI